MKINAQIIISDGVIQNQMNGQSNVVQNPTLLIGLPYMPSAASFTITVVAGLLSDVKIESITLKLSLQSPNGQDVFKIDESKVGPFHPEMKDSNLVLNTELRNIPIEVAGEYLVNVVIDGQEFSQKFFIVKNQIPVI